jgi:hypothetical protein
VVPPTQKEEAHMSLNQHGLPLPIDLGIMQVIEGAAVLQFKF